jgi:hypothetical protein
MAKYSLPTKAQILFHFPVKPCAKVVAMIIQHSAEDQVPQMSEKSYNHMSQQDQDAFDSEQRHEAKVYISTGKLAELANASEEGVESALDELQKKMLVDSDRPVGKPKHRGNKRYYFRLHQPSVAPSKKAAGSS